jgi:sugar phosphate isomerase/epimerase
LEYPKADALTKGECSMAKMTLGLQLFTVREDMKKDFKGTLAAVAQMGYEAIETGAPTEMGPEEFAAFIKSLGLVTAGVHAGVDELMVAGSRPYQYAKALKCPHVTISAMHDVDKDWDALIEKVKKAAVVAKQEGFQFTYHNHHTEFKKFGDEYALDILYARTDGSLVQCELDTYWIKRGGEDPVPYIRKYKGRTPEIHLKDMDPADESFTEIGNGCMDLPAIFDAARYVGAKWIIVEQDRWKGTGLQSARISIDNLKTKGLI